MKEEWKSGNLDRLCEVNYGTRVVKKRDAGIIYPVYGGGGATFNMDEYNREDSMVIARFAMSETCTRFVKGKFFLNDSGLTVDTKDSNVLNQDFLDWQILSLNDTIYSLGRGTAQKNLNVESFRKLEIKYPKSLNKQKQIVSILDKAFAAIDQAKANIEKNIQNAEELFQSKLNEVFSQKGEGWEEKKLGDACNIIMGQSPKGTSYNSEGIGTPLINGPVEFGPNPFSETVESKWTTEPTKMCNKGDLILCVRGSTTGRINIAGFNACIGRGVASIRYTPSQDWINFFIRCSQQKIYDLGTGSTFPNVSSKILSELTFSEPTSVEIRKRIIANLKELDKNTEHIVARYHTKIESLDELKSSILQKAFSGELTSSTEIIEQVESAI